MFKTVVAAMALLTLLPHASAEGQEARGLTVFPRVGAHLPYGKVSYRGPGEPSPDWIRLDPGLALGTGIEFPTRFRPLWVRTDLMLGLTPSVTGGTRNGTRPCGPNCDVAHYDEERVGRGASVFLGGSAVLRPAPSGWAVQPAIRVGGAWKRRFYDTEFGDDDDVVHSLAAEAEEFLTHVGFGVDFHAFGRAMSLGADLYAGVDVGGPFLLQG